MIGILLGILKWIGILLLAILGLVLTIVLIVLLVPVRYRLQGARSPEDGVLTAGGKVSWLLSVFAVTFAYDQEFSWKVKICGIPLKLGKKSVEEDVEDLTEEQIAQIAELEAEWEEDLEAESKAKLKTESHSQSNPTSKVDLTKKEVHNTDSTLRLQAQEMGAQKAENQTTEAQAFDSLGAVNEWENTESLEEADLPAENAEKVPLKEKLRRIIQKISDMIRSIPEKIAGIKEKIRSLKEKADTWIAFLKSDEVKQLLVTCKKQIGQILRHLIPTQLKIRGNYGFEDPSLTGKITGFICALPPRYQKNIQVQPHFQEVCLDGEAVLKGRIRLGSLVWPVIKILVKPCTWKVYKKFRAITKPQTAADGAQASAKAAKGGKSTKKESGTPGGSHKKKATNKKNDPHKGGKQ